MNNNNEEQVIDLNRTMYGKKNVQKQNVINNVPQNEKIKLITQPQIVQQISPQKPKIIIIKQFDTPQIDLNVDKNQFSLNETQKEKNIVPPIENSNILEKTVLRTFYQNCINCQLPIKNDSYQLDCKHTYHTNCLIEFIKNQIEQNQVSIKCFCKINIKQRCVYQLLNDNNPIDPRQEKNYYIQKQFKNQLEEIKRKYPEHNQNIINPYIPERKYKQ